MTKRERFILATLVLDTALHLGTGKGGEALDSPLRRTGDGQILLSGRAMGGSLRTLATRLAPRLGLAACVALSGEDRKPCGCPTCRLFGDLYPSEETAQRDGGAASYLWVQDAWGAERLPTHARDAVGLSRRTGVAARHVKFEYEVIPRGTRFALRLRLLMGEDETAEQLLVAALAEWEAGRGQLGGKVGRGLGRFHLEEVRWLAREIGDAQALVDYLAADEPWQASGAMAEQPDAWRATVLDGARKARVALPPDTTLPAAGGFVTVAFSLVPEGPFLVHDPLVATLAGFDHAPQVEVALRHDEQGVGSPLLPGSSLRGVWRARAERIARTMALQQWSTEEEFRGHCPACDPLARAGEPLTGCSQRLTEISEQEETPEAALCLACQLFGSTQRGSRLQVADGHWEAAPPDGTSWHAQDFLAIDRFTGGGRDGAKFDAAPLVQGSFRASLTLHEPRAWELGWLLLLLRDLAEGEMTVGFGAAKGYGRLRTQGFHWTVGFLTESDLSFMTIPVQGRASALYDLLEVASGTRWLPEGWLAQGQGWVDRLHEEIEGFTLTQAFGKDASFFGKGDSVFEPLTVIQGGDA